MTPEQIRSEFELASAVRDAFWLYGMRLLPERERDVLAHLRSLGCDVSVSSGYLTVQQTGTGMVISQLAETVRKQFPQWFTADPKRDAVSCRADLERGDGKEIAQAKSKWIQEHGIAAWEALPQTKEEAAKRSVVPDANLTKSQYLALPFSERVRLAGMGADLIAKIMARK